MRRWTTEEEVKFSVMYLGGVPPKTDPPEELIGVI